MMMGIEQILRLNQLAVDLLVAREHQKAYKVLSAALQKMLGLMQDRTPPADRHASCTDGNDIPCGGTLTVRLTSTQGDRPPSCDTFFQLYETAFLVANNESNMAPQEFQDLVAVVLMYNTGLICHRLGAQQGDSKNLRRALSMYEAAYSTLQNDEKFRGDIAFGGYLRFALINNMGHIYSNLFHRVQASSCRKLLQDLIYTTIVNTGALDDSEGFFFLKCLLFFEFEVAVAPAA